MPFFRLKTLGEALGLIGPCRTDPDAINVPFKAGSQCTRILKWLAAGRTLSSMFLIVNLPAASGASRGREVNRSGLIGGSNS